ncbi:uncharacterized protein METZ01_LOCUS142061, partial [marine metagenome]
KNNSSSRYGDYDRLELYSYHFDWVLSVWLDEYSIGVDSPIEPPPANEKIAKFTRLLYLTTTKAR